MSSCARDRDAGYHDAIRKTWAAEVAAIPGLEYKFFLGLGACELAALQPDEIICAAPDDYKSLPYKTIASHAHGLTNGFDGVFQCFTDTYIRPDRLVEAVSPDIYYTGWPNRDGHIYAGGGAGYWTNANACEIIVKTQVDDWAEDRWVGKILLGNFKPDERYCNRNWPCRKHNAQITSHLSLDTGKYDPAWMLKHHQLYLNS